MARLTDKQVKSAKAGRYTDGDGLMLFVKPTGGKSWVLRIQINGKRRDIGLGSVAEYNGLLPPDDDIPLLQKKFLTLSEARLKAATLRQLGKSGRDLATELRKDRGPVPSFAEATRIVHKAKSPEWSAKTAASFLSTLEQHAFPHIGSVLISEVDEDMIAKVLLPIWMAKPLMARKVRQRIGYVVNYAVAKKWRSGGVAEGAISQLLPTQFDTGHFAAMPYKKVPAFVTSLREDGESIGRLALLFLIFTAARSGEVRGACWSQIDKQERLWNRPASLMKGRNAKSHIVTLNSAALAVLEIAASHRRNDNDLVFPSRSGRPLSDMALSSFMEGLDATPHGFRSSFRDWAAEKMPHLPDPVAEAALAHKVPDKVIAAYKRTTFLELRRELLEGWGAFASNANGL
jgi:integrase